MDKMPPSDVQAIDDPASRPWKRDVSYFLAGQAVSLFGSMIVQYAVMWYLTLETKDGVVLALSTVFGFLPQAIVSVFGGVWADRHNRKWLIMGADLIIATTTLILAILMLSGQTNLWFIFGALAIRSAGAGVQTPAVGAIIPQIVPQDQLLRINGINQSIQSGMMLLAPALAALLYTLLPLGAIFFVDVFTAIIGVGLLAVIPITKVARDTEPVGYLEDMKIGLRYARSHSVVRWLLALNAFVMVLAAAPSALTPLMAARTFGGEVWHLTVLELGFSIGMLIAGATVGFWGNKVSRITLIIGSSMSFGVLSIGLGLSPNVWVFFGVMFLFGLAVPAFATPSMTIVQETVEPDRQGRVFGLFGIVQALALPIGMAVFGPLANQYPVETVLIGCGIATVIVSILAVTTPAGRRATRSAREHAAAVTAPPSPQS